MIIRYFFFKLSYSKELDLQTKSLLPETMLHFECYENCI